MLKHTHGVAYLDSRTGRVWGKQLADSDGRPNRRLEDKYHFWGCRYPFTYVKWPLMITWSTDGVVVFGARRSGPF